ncbi:Acyl dehydratase [Mesobacillus persicus]|uniref:Acyl dehydratase n=1 Tax=Mesobacillus persicus TaxID=930146 RepID=A0A1H8DC69_9BACI|nr:MaoC/PaaZ C-terminal domain-containing protein [Mesobacillus persicus]SEN04756.1 Acyl dehydratase [Mesobacillus persicus]
MLAVAGLKVGQEFEALTKPPVTKVQLVKYAGASGDYNPLHTDDEFARKIGMDGVIAHGMLIMGFLGEYVMQLAGTTAEVAQFRMRFGGMTKPGDEIKCSAVVEDVYEEKGQSFVVLALKAAKSGEEIVGSGQAVLRFH